jgi:amino acid adenylation domain-containing protein
VTVTPESASPAAVDELLARSNLTARQLLIYAGQRLSPDILLYDAVYAVSWPDLALPRFRLAWQQLLDTCDALRTIVEEVDGIPRQRVLNPYPLEVEYVELPRAEGSDAPLECYLQSRLERPLVLQQRAFDTAVIRTSAHQHVWYLNLHHVIADAAAAELLIERLYRIYHEEPGALALAPLPSFMDQVARRRSALTDATHRDDTCYWRQRLAGLPAPTPPYGITAIGARQERVLIQLDEQRGRAIAALARTMFGDGLGEHAAASNLFCAAFAMFLTRVSGSRQVTIGSTAHNRRNETERRTIGLLMEVLPLALTLDAEDGLAQVMRQAASVTREALHHRGYSVPNSSRSPHYLALINYMRPLVTTPPGLTVRRIHPGHGAHALALSISPPREGHAWQLWLDVNAILAQSIGAERIAAQFRMLLEAAVADPQRSLACLPLLAAGEVHRIRSLCYGPHLAAGLRECGCHKAFELQVTRRPEATAVAFGGGTESYTQLNRRANRLAHELMGRGIGRGALVGIHLERSLEMIVAVLAVLKSGAAYLPLDPAYPATRLQHMLEETDAAIIITDQTLAAQLTPAARPILLLPLPETASLDVADPGVNIRRADPAYVMYTSGSTGTPKGVMVTHGGVVNYLEWRNSYFPLTPTDRCLHKASLSFDDSVWEILEPLGAGACIVLARPHFEYDGAYLAALMAGQQVSAACLVPTLLRAFIEEPQTASCVSLRRLTTGGETLSVALQRRVLERLPSVKLYNGYGATETTIASSFWQCADDRRASVPIGRPIANTTIYVLDDAGQLLPIGVPGELYVGGAGVAAGYLRQPALTAARFTAATAAAPGERLYRTGDRGRLRDDGVLEFLGRVDEQVKINGVRVEPGEVEAHLLSHALVRAAAVVCHEPQPGSKRLVAYVVPAHASALSAAELRRYLRTCLSPSLVPGRYVLIDALPSTPSGKLDRNALATATASLPELTASVDPRDAIERQLLEIWQAMLDVRPIGVQDDFFDLGGHSLLAVQLAAAIARQFKRHLPPGLLFEAPTIEALALRLAAPQSSTTPSILVKLRAEGDRVPLFCIHHVRGNVNCYRELTDLLVTEQPVYGLEVSGGAVADGVTIETLAARYVEEVLACQPVGPYAIAGYSAGGLIAYEMARLLVARERTVALLAILDTDAGTRARRVVIDPLRFHLDNLARLGPLEAIGYLWHKICARWRTRAGAAKPAAPADTPGDPLMAALDHAVERYRPREYAGGVMLFRATDRRVTRTYARTLGWRALAGGGVRVIDIPGDHRTIVQTGPVRMLSSRLSECLARINASSTPT